jgi:hypothetical protein
MIKLIAMLTMLIDHIGVAFFPNALWLRVIGRIAFPLFAWGIARGYKHTRNFKWYALRLLAAGLVSQLPYVWLFGKDYLNICFTLLTGLLVLKLFDSKALPVPVKVAGMAALLAAAHYMNMEYGIYGIFTILIFFLFWDDKRVFLYQSLLTLAGIIVYRYHEIQLVSIFASFIVMYWHKYDFKLNKLVQYGFYPLHIIVLLLIRYVIH